MTIKLGDIEFKGMSGTLQRPKPVIETYTRLGDKKVYVQRLRTESVESSLEAWSIFETYKSAIDHEREVAKIIGLPLVFQVDDNETIAGVFLKDYTYSLKVGIGSGGTTADVYLVRYSLTLVCDEVSGVEG